MKPTPKANKELREEVYNNLPTCAGGGSLNCTFKTPSVVCKRATDNILEILTSDKQKLLKELMEQKVEAENVYEATDVVDVVPLSVIQNKLEGLEQ
jgi:hypothetical protein